MQPGLFALTYLRSRFGARGMSSWNLPDLAMIRIYSDDSEIDTAGPRVFTLAGLVASPSAWDGLTEPWTELLNTVGPRPAKALHMKYLTSGTGEFADWSQEERDGLIIGVLDLLLHEDKPGGGPIALLDAIGCSIVVDDFAELTPGWDPSSNALYLLCYQSFFFQVLQAPAIWNGIDFVFDRRKGVLGHVLERFSAAKDIIEPMSPGKLGGCGFDDDDKYPALQAADLLAWELRRRVWQRRAHPDRPARKSYERFKNGVRNALFRCYDKRFLETFSKLSIDRADPAATQWAWFTTEAPAD